MNDENTKDQERKANDEKTGASTRWPLIVAGVVLVAGLLVIFFFADDLFNQATSNAILILPEESLQAALDDAQAGDVFALQSGATYEGPVIIRTEGITLRSSGRDPAVITTEDDDVITVYASDVLLQNLEIQGGSRGVVIDRAAGVRVLNNRLRDNEVAIEAGEADNILVEGNDIQGSQFMSISLSRAVSNSVVENNRLTEVQGLAIRVTNSSNNLIQSNVVDDSPQLEIGLQISLGTKNQFVDNQIRSITQRDVGILLQSTQQNSVVGNQIKGFQIGVLNERSRENRVANNQFEQTALGVRVNMSVGTIIEGNEIKDVGIGIHLNDSEGLTLRDNRVEGAQQFAFQIEFNTGLEASGNTATNSRLGIFLGIVSDSQIRNNVMEKNEWGMAALNSKRNTITGNKIQNSEETGLSVMLTEQGALQENTIANNEISGNRIGMNLIHAPGNQVTGNTIRNNKDVGLLLSYAGLGTTISQNTIENNATGVRIAPAIELDPAQTVLSVFQVPLTISPEGDNSGYTISQNNLVKNAQFGLDNQDADTPIDAASNWWGNASGPGGVGSGSGNAVSAFVSYDPWLQSQATPAP